MGSDRVAIDGEPVDLSSHTVTVNGQKLGRSESPVLRDENDKLDEMFAGQKAFDKSIIEERDVDLGDTSQTVEKLSTALFTEVAELVEETNWKWWKDDSELSKSDVIEELTDVLFFVLSLYNRLGLSSGDIYAEYFSKLDTNFDRQEGKTEKDGYAVNGN